MSCAAGSDGAEVQAVTINILHYCKHKKDMLEKETIGLKPRQKKKICGKGRSMGERRGPKMETLKIQSLKAISLIKTEQAYRVTVQLQIPSLHVAAKQEKVMPAADVRGKVLSSPGRAPVREHLNLSHWLHG